MRQATRGQPCVNYAWDLLLVMTVEVLPVEMETSLLCGREAQRLCVLLVPVSTKEFNRGGLATMGLKMCHTGETSSPCSSLSQRP